MRFWQGMLLGVVVGGITGLVVYNNSSARTRAMMNQRARKASEMIGTAAKAMKLGPMMNNR